MTYLLYNVARAHVNIKPISKAKKSISITEKSPSAWYITRAII